MTAVIVSPILAIAAWFAVNFLGKPILALREKRLEALQIAERYSHVSISSSDALRAAALKSLNDVANALRGISREQAASTRMWCWLFGYDLEFASRCLFGLAEGPRGEYSISPVSGKVTLDALFVSLGAMSHLSPDDVAVAKREIATTKATSATETKSG